MTDLIGTRLNQYELKDIIRSGGMATVYKAYQDSLDRFVAVKVMHANRDPQFAIRFKREARAIAALQHPNILPVYDYGEQEGLLFLVMQYIERGTTLGDMLGRPLAAPTALRLLSRVLDALDYAHQRGVIHRDIKPANVLMPSPTWPMLADFGIAKLINDTQQQLTLANHIIGTAAYMAPEQATGRPIDARTDLYAAGVMLYELVTGRVPFDSDTPMAMLTKHVYEQPPPPRSLNPDVPPEVEKVLQRALAKDPDARYQSAAEMSAALSQIANHLELNLSTPQIADLYQSGVQAFEEGRWEEAVDRLSQLIALNPHYEDAPDLLDAARVAQERARTEARQQMELVRQRRQSGVQAQVRPATDATLVSATEAATSSGSMANTPYPSNNTAIPRPATTSVTRRLFPEEAAVNQPQGNSASVLTPTSVRGRRSPLLWIIAGGVAVVVLAIVLFLFLRAQFIAGNAVATVVVSAPTSAVPTEAAHTTPTAANNSQATSAPVINAPTSATGNTAEGETAPPIVGDPVYTDDFSDPAKSGLENQTKAPDFERGIHPPGVYHLRVLSPNDSRVELFARRLFQNFQIQIDLQDNSDDFHGSVSQGLIFRAQDRQHFYAWQIDPRVGKYALLLQNGDTTTELIPWTASSVINLDNEANQLRVDSNGNQFTAYLNGMKLADFSDSTYPNGMIGFMVANVDAPMPHMHFDNLTIWSSDPVPAGSELEVQRTNPNGDLVLVPGGLFVFGSNDNRDQPPQILDLPDFYIDQTEVTNAHYRACVNAQACTPLSSPASQTHPDYANQATYDQFPVVNVSWPQAVAFCSWAGKRLPTEAEWEKAASWDATTQQKMVWPWGNTFDQSRLNSDESKQGDTTAVGSYPPELNNTLDMAGNVSEWTSSLFLPFPYNATDGREDATSPDDRVYRGGSWAQTEGKARGIYRVQATPNGMFNEVGFRCAATP